MKFKIKERSKYSRNPYKIFASIVLLLFLLNPIIGNAQPIQFEFNNSTLSKAINEVAQKMNIRVSFDSGLLEKTSITKKISGNNANEILSSILEGNDLALEFKYDTYLIYYQPQAAKKPTSSSEHDYSGIVFDKETGERLPYATINHWEKNIPVSATVEGTFSIRLKDSAYSVIQIKYLGYQPLDTVINTNQNITFLRIGLIKNIQNIATVDIKGNKMGMIDFSDEAGHLTFNPAKFADLPNYGETDIFRALQLLPGISSYENSSQLNIRGGTSDQNLVLLDGFTLYNLDHFFGTFSALNPNIIKNIQVYRGGFDSRYGERVSGIVDIVGKSGNQLKPEFYGGINMISGNLTAEIPINSKLTLIAAGRRAYTDIYSSWLADELLGNKLGNTRRIPAPNANVITPEFYFGDFNTKMSYNINTQENISFSIYGSKDNLNSSNYNTNEWGEMNTSDSNKWGNYGFGASWNKQWGTKLFSSVVLGHSGYYNDYKNYTTITFNNETSPQPGEVQSVVNETTNEKNDLTDYFITLRNEYSLNKKHNLEFGVTSKFNQFTYYKDATRDFIYSNLESSAFLHTLFTQDKINLNNKFTIKPGVRVNYYSNSGKFYIEPRFIGSYKTDFGLVLKFATGKYYQFLNKSGTEQTFGYNRNFWVLSDEDIHPLLKSNHYISGFSFEKNNFYFDVEGYFKTVSGLQEYLFFDNPGERQPGNPPPAGNNQNLSQFISGKGKAMGIDFLFKYEGLYFSSWLAYSLSKATRKFHEINNGNEIPTEFDQTHELKWTNIYNYKKWNFSTLCIYNTGKPYIEFSTKDENFNTIRTYNRLPYYFRIDFSANYNLNLKKINLNPGVSILNAFNTENYLDAYTRVFNRENQSFNETTLIKAQSLTFNFFINFRF